MSICDIKLYLWCTFLLIITLMNNREYLRCQLRVVGARASVAVGKQRDVLVVENVSPQPCWANVDVRVKEMRDLLWQTTNVDRNQDHKRRSMVGRLYVQSMARNSMPRSAERAARQ